MGQVTPNIGIYIPAAGETNYDASFAAGMVNIDQHDHSGGPNKGVPITSTGIADGAITFNLLNANVADAATGIGVPGSLGANQLTMLGILKNLYQLATATGFIAKNGSAVTARTFQDAANQILWTNPAGVAGNPSAALANPLYLGGVSFDAGANTLGNYATSTFTPTIDGSVPGATTYTSQNGYYTRIGNMVFCTGDIRITAATGTGNVIIGGLPFTIANLTNNDPVGTMDFASAGFAYPAGTSYLTLSGITNTTTCRIDALGSTTSGNLQMTNNAATVRFSLFYRTT